MPEQGAVFMVGTLRQHTHHCIRDDVLLYGRDRSSAWFIALNLDCHTDVRFDDNRFFLLQNFP